MSGKLKEGSETPMPGVPVPRRPDFVSYDVGRSPGQQPSPVAAPQPAPVQPAPAQYVMKDYSDKSGGFDANMNALPNQTYQARDWTASPYTDTDWEQSNDPNRGATTQEMTPAKERQQAAQHAYAVEHGYETAGAQGGYSATDKFKQYQAGRQQPQPQPIQPPQQQQPLLGKGMRR
jgi:hypothetical protein